jgi:hypothetical protein
MVEVGGTYLKFKVLPENLPIKSSYWEFKKEEALPDSAVEEYLLKFHIEDECCFLSTLDEKKGLKSDKKKHMRDLLVAKVETFLEGLKALDIDKMEVK